MSYNKLVTVYIFFFSSITYNSTWISEVNLCNLPPTQKKNATCVFVNITMRQKIKWKKNLLFHVHIAHMYYWSSVSAVGNVIKIHGRNWINRSRVQAERESLKNDVARAPWSACHLRSRLVVWWAGTGEENNVGAIMKNNSSGSVFIASNFVRGSLVYVNRKSSR